MGQVIDFEKYKAQKELEHLSQYSGDLFMDTGLLLHIPEEFIAHGLDNNGTITITLDNDPELYTHHMYTLTWDSLEDER